MTSAWYFYASPNIEYTCRFNSEEKIPELFHGPYEHQYAAVMAYREWKLTQMEREADEYAE